MVAAVGAEGGGVVESLCHSLEEEKACHLLKGEAALRHPSIGGGGGMPFGGGGGGGIVPFIGGGGGGGVCLAPKERSL